MNPANLPAIAAVSSPDHNAERLAELKRLFPDLFTNEGQLNMDELKKVVDPTLVSETERYDFRWYGKTASKREAFTPSRAALVYDKDRSVNPEKAGGNMIIEGENLEVLKLLTSAYRERVKCIYIDPPYNTGKDFVYSDRFAEGQKPYWAQTGVTEDGVKVDTNTDSEGRFHSNWLSMMHSRLLVARYLLRKDGVIFVSIDDNEVQNLRRVMDEVFGEENFAGVLVWQKSKKGDAKLVARNHEYTVVYVRDREHALDNGVWRRKKPGVDEVLAKYDEIRTKLGDEAHEAIQEEIRAWYSSLAKADPRRSHQHYRWSDKRGLYFADNFAGPDDGRESRPRYDIIHPITKKPCAKPSTGWRWDEERTNDALAQDPPRIHFGPDETTIPCRKTYLFEVQSEPFASVFYRDGRAGTLEVESLVGKGMFDFPKDKEVLGDFFALTTRENDVVLDFFGGSGTTAQAVMELNKADGGNRQFILVQLPELTAADSTAQKSGFKRISEITIERAKRVIARIQKDAEGLLPGDPQREFADGLGFKVFKLAKSHFPRVEFAPDPDKTEAENIDLLKQYIRDKEATFHIQWERETVLDEVLLKNGFMLDYTLTPHPEFKKNEVFLAKDAHKESLICLDATIAPETVDHFKKHPEPFFICLELALDTTKKWNLKHHLGDKLKAF